MIKILAIILSIIGVSLSCFNLGFITKTLKDTKHEGENKK